MGRCSSCGAHQNPKYDFAKSTTASYVSCSNSEVRCATCSHHKCGYIQVRHCCVVVSPPCAHELGDLRRRTPKEVGCRACTSTTAFGLAAAPQLRPLERKLALSFRLGATRARQVRAEPQCSNRDGHRSHVVVVVVSRYLFQPACRWNYWVFPFQRDFGWPHAVCRETWWTQIQHLPQRRRWRVQSWRRRSALAHPTHAVRASSVCWKVSFVVRSPWCNHTLCVVWAPVFVALLRLPTWFFFFCSFWTVTFVSIAIEGQPAIHDSAANKCVVFM